MGIPPMKKILPLLLALAANAAAQCVMCFRTAAAQQAERARVLNEGILVLLLPPLFLISGLCWLAWSRRDS